MISQLKGAVRALGSYLVEQTSDERPPNPEPGRWISGQRDDYSSAGVIRQVTPARLGDAMKAAESGDTARQMYVFELSEQDSHISCVYARRRRAALARRLTISPSLPGDGRSEQAADLCRELILGDGSRDGIHGLPMALFDLTDAVGKGYAAAQIVWQLDSGRWIPERLERWPQGEFVLGDARLIYDGDVDELRVISSSEPSYGESLAPGQWIVHIQRQWSVHLSKAALARGWVWPWLFKRFSWRDWVIFSERYGMPLRKGTYGPTASDGDKAQLIKALKGLSRDSWCLLPEGSMIELIETAPGRLLPYPEMITRCNNEISKLVLGNPLTTEPGDRGARSLGEVYERAEVTLTNWDCENLAHTLRDQLCGPIVRYNLGDGWPVPDVSFVADEQLDLVQQSTVDRALLDMGVPLPVSYFYATYGRPIPEQGEDLASIGGEPEPEPEPTVP